MLTSGAAVVEAIAVWLYFQGQEWWVVAASALLGAAVLLVLDWALQRREPPCAARL
jgi:ABC-type Fe3+-siderophore transport system permease subunit